MPTAAHPYRRATGRCRAILTKAPNGATVALMRARYSISCQPNFVIVISDGLQNELHSFYDHVRRPTAIPRIIQPHSREPKTLLVHAVGFAIDASEPDDEVAAMHFFSNGEKWRRQLLHQLTMRNSWKLPCENAISQILAAAFSFATPVIPTTGTSWQHESLSGVVPVQSITAILARLP